MKNILIIILCALSISCASIENYRGLDQETNEILTTSVGGSIFRLNRTSDLPNAFGKADLYGGKVDRGYAEVKFKGISSNGELILQVIDVNKRSSETTMDRYMQSVNVNQNVSIGESGSPEMSTFLFDLSKEKELIIANVKIIFLSAKPYSVSYKLIDLNR
jgi:hypothetical protein